MPPPRRRTSAGTIEGPAGGYFHKQYGGIKQPRIEHDLAERAVLYVARQANDKDDFVELSAMLGLTDVLRQVRDEQRTAREDDQP